MVFLFLFNLDSFSQVIRRDSLLESASTKDTIPKKIPAKGWSASGGKEKHSPRKATIMSACLPGLGQAYNRKYWKIPIVYAGIGTFAYFAYYTNGLYSNYKNEYIYRTKNPNNINSFPEFSSDQLKVKVDTYRRYRDLNIILIAAVYTLNLVDANVDAHMFTFDVSNDLSLHIAPNIGYSSFTGTGTAELKFELKF